MMLIVTMDIFIMTNPVHADSVSKNLGQVFGGFLGLTEDIEINSEELRGVGCIVVGGGVGAISLGFGGTVMAFAGLPGVTTGVVAAPVLATAVWAGCALGSTAAPGFAWLIRNSQVLFKKIGNAMPNAPST